MLGRYCPMTELARGAIMTLDMYYYYYYIDRLNK